MAISGQKARPQTLNHATNATNCCFQVKTVGTLRFVISHVEICECDYCGAFIHEQCIFRSKFHCKQLTSTKPEIKHLW